MVNKKELLTNIVNYSSEEIAEAVKNGVVSLYELDHETNGAFTPLLRKKVKELLAEQNIVFIEQNDAGEISETENPIESRAQTLVDTPCADKNEAINNIENTLPTPPVEEQTFTTNVELKPKPKPRMFRNPFSFKGRIRRTEYGLSMIIGEVLLFYISFGFVTEFDDADVSVIIALIMYILDLWFLLAQGAKRCHDMGDSGWYMLINLVFPFYSLLILFAKGTNGANKYGSSPK